MDTVLILAGAGLIFWWWTTQSASSVLSGALPLLSNGVPVQLTSGQSVTIGTQTLAGPGYLYYSGSTYYVSTTAPTAAQIAAATPAASTTGGTTATGTQTGTSSATTPAGGTSTGSTPTGTQTGFNTLGEPITYVGGGGSTYTTPMTLSALASAIQQWAAVDPSYTGSGANLSASPYHWATTMQAIWPDMPTGFTAGWPVDLGTIFPGVDLTQPMTWTAFWAGMLPFLQSGGLSGLRGMRGLGAIRARSPYAA
jgi:hypothetical protein